MKHAAAHPELQTGGAPERAPSGTERRPEAWARITILLYGVAIVLGILDLPEVATAGYLLPAAPGALMMGGEGLRMRRTTR
jgi:hypothetical protein